MWTANETEGPEARSQRPSRRGYDPMNAYGMELYAETRLQQAHEEADIRRLLRTARSGTEQPSRWRHWLRLDRHAARHAGLAEAS
jgi:hypothetical protein